MAASSGKAAAAAKTSAMTPFLISVFRLPLFSIRNSYVESPIRSIYETGQLARPRLESAAPNHAAGFDCAEPSYRWHQSKAAQLVPGAAKPSSLFQFPSGA
jgi:hypothetical protein